MIPISCLTEFPNVVQMAKVGDYNNEQFRISLSFGHHMLNLLEIKEYIYIFQLVCEEVNVDRFYPVLYPKVGIDLDCNFSLSSYKDGHPLTFILISTWLM